MTDFLKLPVRTANGDVHAIVETPRGSRAKLKYEPELGGFVLSKSLMLGLTYPYDWGFIPSTLADDGDPLDILVIHDARFDNSLFDDDYRLAQRTRIPV